MNQRGFATLEIILVVVIISVLTTTAVPQMARMIDGARLDYEMKRFLNNLELAKSLNRGTYYKQDIFENHRSLDDFKPEEITIHINNNSYEMFKGSDKIGETITFPEGFSLKLDTSLTSPLKFATNNNGTLTIISKLGSERKIIFDSVGRWRGSNGSSQ